VAAVFERLEIHDLFSILKNPNNPIILGKKKDFKSYDIDIQFEDEALYELAVKAHEEKTGARGLVSAAEKVLLKFEKHLPSTDIRKLIVTCAVVKHPNQELERLLQDPLNPEMLQRFEALLSQERLAMKQSILDRETEFKKRYGMFFREGRINLIINRMIEKGYDVNTVFEEAVEIQRLVEDFERDFQRRNGIYIRFDEEAIDRITEIALEEDGKGCEICARLSKDYEHGFRLIRDKIGPKEFVLTREAVDSPESYLNRVIRDIYSKQSESKSDGNQRLL